MIDAEVLGRLLAMRDVLDGLIASLGEEPPAPSCPHPAEQREYIGEMGNVQGFKCRACGGHVAADAAQGS